jgi:hypothetical protein
MEPTLGRRHDESARHPRVSATDGPWPSHPLDRKDNLLGTLHKPPDRRTASAAGLGANDVLARWFAAGDVLARRLLAVEHSHLDPETGSWLTRGQRASGGA